MIKVFIESNLHYLLTFDVKNNLKPIVLQ